MTADELLPGAELRGADGAEAARMLPVLARRLAAAAEVDAMAEVAEVALPTISHNLPQPPTSSRKPLPSPAISAAACPA